MIFYLIPTIIIFLCLGVIISIIARNFSTLANINLDSIAKEKEAKVKNRIMAERLGRRFYDLKKQFSEFFTPLIIDLTGAGSKLYHKVMELEKRHAPKKAADPEEISAKIAGKIEQVNKLVLAADLVAAEEECISILELDPRSVEAYKLLTSVYLTMREYKKARETCRFLIKLLLRGDDRHALANAYADLGSIYQLENKNSYALLNFQKAVFMEPSNPRFLDLLLKISIILMNKKLALQTFSLLREADPENQKLPEIMEEIDKIQG